MRIGLFDSGVGGLTVLKALKEKYKNNDYIYYGDTLNLPYGSKTKEELLKLAENNIEFLINKKVDMIIIACGTVSSNCLEELQNKYPLPIFSIINPTIDYLNKSIHKNILIMATEATINSHIFKNNIRKNVYEIACPKLVPLIENNNLDNITSVLHEYLDEYLNKIDAIVLGCTHYPIIQEHIKNIVNKDTVIIDMANIINIPNDGNKNTEIYFSKIDDNIINNTKKILKDKNLIIK